MKKYWIIVDGQPQGPFSVEELRVRSDFNAQLPVWTSGMAEWSTVGQVSDLAMLLEQPIDVQPIADEAHPAQDEPTAHPYTQFDRPHTLDAPLQADESVELPRTYLIWNVLLTVVMFWPTGLVGVIYSYFTARRLRQGDVSGAMRMSNCAAWCLIVTFTMGCVSMPFSVVNSFNALMALL